MLDSPNDTWPRNIVITHTQVLDSPPTLFQFILAQSNRLEANKDTVGWMLFSQDNQGIVAYQKVGDSIEAVGVLIYREHTSSYVEIDLIAIADRYRKKRLASMLIDSLLKKYKDTGIVNLDIIATVGVNNALSRGFFDSNDFVAKSVNYTKTVMWPDNLKSDQQLWISPAK